MMQGCRLARLFGKSIMDFYARNQYFLMNTQPTKCAFWLLMLLMLLFIFLYIINVEKLVRPTVENTLVKLIKKPVIL